MNKRFCIAKLMPLWIVLSVLILAAGVVLTIFFGFNYVAEETKTFEVTYNAVVTINEKEEDLQDICETAFSANGLEYTDKTVSDLYSASYFSATGEVTLTYTFSGDASGEALSAAMSSVKSSLSADELYTDVAVSVHTLTTQNAYEAMWRGAIAIFCGVVLALVYVGIRFGVGKALAGLIGCVNDGLLAVCLVVLCRIPVYAYTPVLLAAIASAIGLGLWLVVCAKMRGGFKKPEYAASTAEEAVQGVWKESVKPVLAICLVLAIVFAVLGAVATSGVRLFMLTCLIAVALGLYSTLVLAPSVYVPMKAKSDLSKKRKQQRYNAAKKAEEE